MKEEERINNAIKILQKDGKISERLAADLTSKGAKPARLYGLAKIHKDNTPLRPVMSTPGSAYYKIGKKVAKWLEILDESQIKCNTQKLMKTLRNIKLEPGRKIVSFDVKSLYTNVPVNEAIELAASKLFDGENNENKDRKEYMEILL